MEDPPLHQVYAVVHSLLAIPLAAFFIHMAIRRWPRIGALALSGLVLLAFGYLVAVWMLVTDPQFTDDLKLRGSLLVIDLGASALVVAWLLRVRVGRRHRRRKTDWNASGQRNRWGDL